MSEERKKKSEAAWETKEDEDLNESRAFVEITEYIANAVENDKISLHLPNFISISHITLCGLTSVSLPSSFGTTIYNLLFLGSASTRFFLFSLVFYNLDLQNVR